MYSNLLVLIYLIVLDSMKTMSLNLFSYIIDSKLSQISVDLIVILN